MPHLYDLHLLIKKKFSLNLSLGRVLEMHLVTEIPDLLQRCRISNQISVRDAASLRFASPDKKIFLLNLSLGRVLEMHLVTEIPDLL